MIKYMRGVSELRNTMYIRLLNNSNCEAIYAQPKKFCVLIYVLLTS